MSQAYGDEIDSHLGICCYSCCYTDTMTEKSDRKLTKTNRYRSENPRVVGSIPTPATIFSSVLVFLSSTVSSETRPYYFFASC